MLTGSMLLATLGCGGQASRGATQPGSAAVAPSAVSADPRAATQEAPEVAAGSPAAIAAADEEASGSPRGTAEGKALDRSAAAKAWSNLFPTTPAPTQPSLDRTGAPGVEAHRAASEGGNGADGRR
jgi:hypothetical protein